MRLTSTFNVRVTDETKLRIQRLAESANRCPSDYARSLLLYALEHFEPEFEAELERKRLAAFLLPPEKKFAQAKKI